LKTKGSPSKPKIKLFRLQPKPIATAPASPMKRPQSADLAVKKSPLKKKKASLIKLKIKKIEHENENLRKTISDYTHLVKMQKQKREIESEVSLMFNSVDLTPLIPLNEPVKSVLDIEIVSDV